MENTIYLIRGDTETIRINFTKDGKEYKPGFLNEPGFFTFTVRDKYSNMELIKKQIQCPKTSFNIVHDDTSKLSNGNYIYDIEYRTEEYETVKTLIRGDLVIGRDVTYD